MYWVYILQSQVSDKYYIGQTNNLENRLLVHNSSDRKTYTSKYRPWHLMKSFAFSERRISVLVEKAIKKRKSRVVIGEIISSVHSPEELLEFLGLNSSA